MEEINKKLSKDIISFTFEGIETYINSNGEMKKKPLGMPDWKKINKDNCKNYDKGKAHAIITGAQSNITVLDFDNASEYDKFISENTNLKECKTIKTNKGYHLYFKYNSQFKTTTDAFKDFKNVDIRNDGGIVFCNPTVYKTPSGDKIKYEDLGGDILEIPGHFFNYLKNKKDVKKIVVNKKEPIQQTKRILKNPEVEQLLDLNLLDGMAFGSWDDWRNVGICMRFITTEEHFIRFSQINKDKYDEKETINFWNSIKENYKQANINTLYHYAKEYDIDKYNSYYNYYIDVTKTIKKGAHEIAKTIRNKLKRHLKYSNNIWWMFSKDENIWVETKEPAFIVIEVIHKHLDYSLKDISHKIFEEKDQAKKEALIGDMNAYSNFYSKVDSPAYYSQIKKHLETLLYEKEFFSLLDNNKYEVAFKNGIYNLKTDEFIEGLNECNYITQTINFNYEKPKEEDIKEVRNILFKINNCNEEHLNYYLGVLGQAMTGDAEKEKSIYFCIGTSGNNGKTLILDALTDIMSCYVGKIERQTFEKGYSKAHKHLTGTKGKRIVYIEELSTKEQDIELLKEIGDGKTKKNEVMFGTDEQINIMFKLIFLSNCIATFKVDGGIENRYKQITLNSNFDKENEEDDYENKRFIQDPTLSDKLKGNLKMALIELIIKAGVKYTKEKKLIIPEDYKEDIKDTLESNDIVKLWFNDNIEYGAEYRIGKEELERNLNKPFKVIQKDIERITKMKYKKDIRINGNKGGFTGFRLKIKEDLTDTED